MRRAHQSTKGSHEDDEWCSSDSVGVQVASRDFSLKVLPNFFLCTQMLLPLLEVTPRTSMVRMTLFLFLDF
jgi:hypothetical protein